ncbi:MAG: ferredoxin [Rhodobacteraceae bacterium]|nr:ferredoxin [Paracoccaceae bacterium]
MERSAAERLDVFGAFHPGSALDLPPRTQTLVLLGPTGPGFWPHVRGSPEFADGQPDPMDRWSRRVIGRMACALGAKALFPFGGPPYLPFLRWAVESGQAWMSPVGLLVHERAGLFASLRGAIALRERIDLPARKASSPCETCDGRPCLNACPVGALGADGYDVPRCRDWLAQPAGAACSDLGCAVRRACPVSARYGREPAQSAFHMRAFTGA